MEAAPEDQAEVLALKTEIRAAGGVVRRRGSAGPEFALVHRPRYDDWTFPKGKAEPGEGDEECALREIKEETGLRVELREELEATEYSDATGRRKRVRWWRMTPLSGAFAPTDEVDELRWLTPDEARELLTYPRDAALLDAVVGD